MPAKKSTRKPASAFPKDFAPFVFEMGFFPDGEGNLLVRYGSTDHRADEVCAAVVEALADSLGLVADPAIEA